MRLRGRVRTLPQKLIAAVLVERMTDVGAVTNELIADPEVVRAVADALAQDERTAAYVLRVDSRHGIVIAARRGAHARPSSTRRSTSPSSVPLVVSVRNQLTIGGDALPAGRAGAAASRRPTSPIPKRLAQVRA